MASTAADRGSSTETEPDAFGTLCADSSIGTNEAAHNRQSVRLNVAISGGFKPLYMCRYGRVVQVEGFRDLEGVAVNPSLIVRS